jgi:AraC-like DNA-binding protein
MEEWKSREMSFPYWRLYWNRSGRAKIVYKNTTYLTPDKLVLIPPNTPFSTEIEGNNSSPGQPYSLRGNRVENKAMEEAIAAKDTVLHLFIHFTLGYPFDSVSPGIYEFPLGPTQNSLLQILKTRLMEGSLQFDQRGSMELFALIFSLLWQIPPDTWNTRAPDPRIMRAIRYMERKIASADVPNRELAAEAGMSVNGFARLLREQTGRTPRQYLMNMRIEKASGLLHHSDLSLEEIAAECGFSDRYYFTRIFSRTMGIPPASYRRTGITGSSGKDV